MALGPEIVINGDFSDGTNGWGNSGATLSVVSGRLNVLGTGSSSRAYQDIALLSGETYVFTGNIAAVDGEFTMAILYSDGYTDNVTVNTPGDYSVELTPTVDGDGELWLRSGVGTTTYDNISVKQIVPDQETTTVEIEWVDSISPAATGNKIYRDDVEIADIANGVQFYSDPDAPAGTESKYEVQAHDGAGDETTQEVEGENMDYITTAS